LKIHPDSSFFDLISDYHRGINHSLSIHRFVTFMRHLRAISVVSEELTPNSEEAIRWNEERRAIHRRLQTQGPATIRKLTFVDTLLETAADLPTLRAENITGYCIIATITLPNRPPDQNLWSYIFESVAREDGEKHSASATWKVHRTNYLHVKRKFQISVGQKRFALPGSYFRQQNGITNVCAHVCAVMMLNNISTETRIITAESINGILKIDHQGTKLRLNPRIGDLQPDEAKLPRGLNLVQLRKVFAAHDYDPVDYYTHPKKRGKKESDRAKSFRDFIYGFIESGFPALFTFTPDENQPDVQHVAAVVGHTWNPHSWMPLARSVCEIKLRDDTFLSPLHWIDDLLIHDETIGVGCALPARSFTPGADPEGHGNLSPKETIGLFPKSYNVKNLGYEAQRIAADFLAVLIKEPRALELLRDNKYTRRLISKRTDGEGNALLKRNLIFRPVLVPIARYLKSLDRNTEQCGDERGVALRMKQHGPHIWLVEVSEPDLYVGHKTKVIDIAVDVKADLSDERVVPFWRAPGTITFHNTDAYSVWKTAKHIPLFNLHN